MWNRRRYGKYHSLTDGKATKRPDTEVAGDDVAVFMNDEQDWVVCSDSHEPIIDRETFDAVQQRIIDRATCKRTRGQRRNKTIYLLSGLLYCRHCGGKMHGVRKTRTKNGKKYIWRSYTCSTYHAHGKSQCTHNKVAADDIEKTVIREIVAKMDRGEVEKAIRRKVEAMSRPKPAPASGRQLAELNRKVEQLTENIALAPTEVVGILMDKLVETKRQRDSLQAELLETGHEPMSDVESLVADAMAEMDILTERFRDGDQRVVQDAIRAVVGSVVLEFKPVEQGKRTIYKCVAGVINLCPEMKIAGTGTDRFRNTGNHAGWVAKTANCAVLTLT